LRYKMCDITLYVNRYFNFFYLFYY